MLVAVDSATDSGRRLNQMTNATQYMMGDGSDAQHYLDTFRRSEYYEPEKALIVAILEDAIHDYQKYRRARDAAGKEQFREAEEWIMHRGKEWIFSFDNVCEFLGLDPECVRRGLRALKRDTEPQRRDRHGTGKHAA